MSGLGRGRCSDSATSPDKISKPRQRACNGTLTWFISFSSANRYACLCKVRQRLRSNRARLSIVRRAEGFQTCASRPCCNVRDAVCLGSRLRRSHYLCSWWHSWNYPRSMVSRRGTHLHHGAHWLRPTRGAWPRDRLRKGQLTLCKGGCVSRNSVAAVFDR